MPKYKRTDNPIVRWCFTLNNPPEDEADPQHMVFLIEHMVNYAVIGFEIGDEGTPHFQGYFELKVKERLAGIKRWWPLGRPHFEPAKGTPQQNRKYCTKSGKYAEHGSLGRERQKSSLPAMCVDIKSGKPMLDVAELDPATYIRNYRGLAAYQTLHSQPRYRPELECYLFYGKTGLGKTYLAVQEMNAFKKPIGKSLWFDGLTPDCTTVLIDEFRGQYPLEDILQLTDKYPLRVEVKGGHTSFNATTIILSTNTHPSLYYEGWVKREEQRDALYRRFTKVYFFYAPQKYKILEGQERYNFYEDLYYSVKDD